MKMLKSILFLMGTFPFSYLNCFPVKSQVKKSCNQNEDSNRDDQGKAIVRNKVYLTIPGSCIHTVWYKRFLKLLQIMTYDNWECRFRSFF